MEVIYADRSVFGGIYITLFSEINTKCGFRSITIKSPDQIVKPSYMKNKHKKAKPRSVMAEIGAVKRACSIEFHNDPIGFIEKVNAFGKQYCEEHGFERMECPE